MKSVLITGGLGTIGSCLVSQCYRRGYKVIILDDFSIGVKENLLYYLGQNEVDNVTVVRGSVLNGELLSVLMGKVDICFHMAALVGTLRVVENPFEMIETNIVGTHNVLKRAQMYGVKVVVPSSSMIYGNNSQVIVDEKDDCFVGGDLRKGLWWYAVSKMADECVVNSMIESGDLKSIIVRPFNVVGPIQSSLAGFVLPRFVSSAMKNTDIPVYGDGCQTRTFCWVNNFVTALFMLIGVDDSWGETYNIGSDQEISILSLAEKVIKITGSKSKIVHLDPGELFGNHFVEIERRVPGLEKLYTDTGLQPDFWNSVDFIINKFVEFYRDKNLDSLWTYKPHF